MKYWVFLASLAFAAVDVMVIKNTLQVSTFDLVVLATCSLLFGSSCWPIRRPRRRALKRHRYSHPYEEGEPWHH